MNTGWTTSTDPGRGGLILTLGILGLLCCGPVGIAAWVMGSGDLKQIEQGEIHQDARGLTQAGMILGIIAVVLWVIAIIIQMVVSAS